MDSKQWKALSDSEVKERKQAGQINRLPGSQNSILPILRRHVFTLFNLLNVILAVALLLVGSYRNMLFLGVVLSNIAIGVFQEIRAKRQHDALTLLAQSPIQVMRDQSWTKLPPDELVLDDLIKLNRGDQIPADGIVLEGVASADESLLTGESVAIAKSEGDTLYGGTCLVGGSVIARLTAVGQQSCAGRLQVEARKIHQPKSHLMQDLQTVIRVVSIVVLPLGAALLWRTLSRGGDLSGAVQGSVASVLGMIPEGLILLTSVSLTAGVIKLGKNKTLVNVLYGIEGLARTDVICIDKTGTLTSGQMSVDSLTPLSGSGREDAMTLLRGICSSFSEDSPTNSALKSFCGDGDTPVIRSKIPFSSDKQWSAAKTENGEWILLGAPERLLSGATLELARQSAQLGLRVLALLRAPDRENAPDWSAAVPMALLTLQDTLRPNVRETISYFDKQGVSLKVISGDSPVTVSQIAKIAGVRGSERYVDMSSLQRPLDYKSLCESYTVFGRTSPDEKRMLVQGFKQMGCFTAMVGDGVNDIPALKEADCAIVMAGGSDAAARIAQINLLDGDFSRLPQVVDEGRRVVNNIARAASLFLLKNIFSLLCTVLLLFLPYPYPFAPIQLTLISTLTIGLPSFVLALEPNHERIQGSFLFNVVTRALPGGICGALLILLALIIGTRSNLSLEELRTLSTLMCSASGLGALILICRPMNKLRVGMILLITLCLTLAILLLPGLFLMVKPPLWQWAIAAAGVPVSIGLQCLGAAILKRLTAKLANLGKKSYT